jgi:hypothetical protein
MQLFAQPWWVNLLILVPVAIAYFWRARPLNIARSQLAWAAAFAAAFGFVEAAVVVYLRAAVGLLPGYHGTLSDVVRLSSSLYEKGIAASEVSLPQSLMTIELFREAATIVMLIAIAMLTAYATRSQSEYSRQASNRGPLSAASNPPASTPHSHAWNPLSPGRNSLREAWAIFLWCFAIWDAAYYAGLWVTIRWPNSLAATDVLFLIPVPWYAQVWFPLLIDAAVLAAILFARGNRTRLASASAQAA